MVDFWVDFWVEEAENHHKISRKTGKTVKNPPENCQKLTENRKKMSPGRPRKFPEVEKMQQAIEAYWESCWGDVEVGADAEGKPITRRQQVIPYTVTGLAVHLGMTRQMLIEYENREEFQDTIKKAKARCEAFAEQCLFTGKNPSGVIFSLKNNYGWQDKQEHEVTGKGGGPIAITRVELIPLDDGTD